MIALRFTTNRNETGFTSEDQVNKKQFNGLCAYDITNEVARLVSEDYSEEDAFQICARKQAEFDNWHAHNTKGEYVVFEGKIVDKERDNQDYLGNRAVIVSLDSYKAYGKLEQSKIGYKCLSIELA